MTENDFLAGYRPADFDRPAVTVDLVLMTIRDGAIHVLLVKREEHPQQGRWSLPGGFVGVDEELGDAARRVMREKAGLDRIAVEQLRTFGEVGRDPRMRVITVAYFALVPAEVLVPALKRAEGPALAQVTRGARASLAGQPLDLAFDHQAIIDAALERLRGRLDYSDVAFRLLPREFTLLQLQQVHETILGRKVNKPAFRKRMLDAGNLVATGRREQGSPFRPAELYRHAAAARKVRA